MDQIAAFFIGLIAATIGAIAAGGGLISIPGMMFLGLSPASAIATTRLNLLGGGLMAIYRYKKAGALLWKHMAYFLLVALVAGIAGPKMLLALDPEVVKRAIGIMLLIMLPVMWYKKDAGTINVSRSKRRNLAGFLVLLLVMIYSTMFGGGGGIFLIYTMVYFFGMTVTEANATGYVITVVATFIALIIYMNGGAISWALGIPSIAGALLGGYLGAHLALKKGVAWVKIVLTLVIIVSGIKLTFF